jgi:NAD(P)-dependent dehydrogenase (short-subunit alcohol dehydrogenase family)
MKGKQYCQGEQFKMKNVIVTGANSGLGLWTAKYLLDSNYRVIMACRDVEKAKKAIQEFADFDKHKEFVIVELDLADFKSIQQFVNNLTDFKSIYGLVCNAGLSYEGKFRYTKNGIEETFGVNYVGHFLLTTLLLEKYGIERIVNVSSELHNPRNKSPFAKADFKAVQELAYPEVDATSTLERQGQSFYATSKLCQILFTYELDRRLNHTEAQPKTMVNAINPGLMVTTNLGRTHKFGENLYRIFLNFIFKLIGIADNPKNSAKAVVKLIDAVTTSGKYYDKEKLIPSSEESYDAEKAKKLWSETLILIDAIKHKT